MIEFCLLGVLLFFTLFFSMVVRLTALSADRQGQEVVRHVGA